MSSRSKNSIINLFVGGGAQIVFLLASFIGRSIFINLLNVDYLGVNGLFTNVLTILSFSELGISSALIFSMYKPAKENDTEKLAALLKIYKIAYRTIFAIIIVLGLVLMPFIGFFVNGETKIIEDIRLVFILYVGHTAATYAFSYRTSILTVYQKDYIVTAVQKLTSVVLIVIQLIVLYFVRNYYLYLSLSIVFTILGNVILHIFVGKKYFNIIKCPARKLDLLEKRRIKSDIGSIFFYKIGNVSLNATDNIIINALISISTVGIGSNYTMIFNGVQTVIDKAFYGMASSLGNLNAGDDVERKKRVFNELTTFVYWMYGLFSIGLALLINDFVSLWVGDDYLFSEYWTVLALAASFYVFGVNLVASNFRTTMGFFKEARLAPAIAAVLNIILSILLGKMIGLCGIFFATAISRLLTFGLFDPIIVFKKGLKEDVKKYYIKLLLFTALTIGIGVVCCFFVSLISLSGLLGFIAKGCVVFFLGNLLYFAFLFKTSGFKGLIQRLISLRQKRKAPNA